MTPPQQPSHGSTVAQILVSCMLSVCMGATYAMGVFTDAVESSARPAGTLNAVWPSAITFYFFLSDLLMLPSAALLSAARDLAQALRATGYVSALGFALFAAAAPAVSWSTTSLVVLAVSTLGVPLAFLSVLVMEHLLAWIPSRFGLAVGLVSASTSIGTGVFSTMFSVFTDTLNVSGAIYASSFVLAALTLLFSMAVRLPPTSPLNTDINTPFLQSAASDRPAEEDTRNSEQEQVTLSLMSLVTNQYIWAYGLAISALSVAYPMLTSFFRLGKSFELPRGPSMNPGLLRVIQGSSAASAVVNLVVPAATDFLHTPQGPLRSGAANVTLFALILQIIAFVVLTLAARTGRIMEWGAAAAITQTAYQASLGFAALLARDVFGTRRMTFVYGAVGGPALAIGDGGSGLFMAILECVLGRRAGVPIMPTDYASYYRIGCLWSAAGAAGVAFIVVRARSWPIPLSSAQEEDGDH